MAEVKSSSDARKRAAWKRLVRRIAPERLVGGRLPADARALLHLLDGYPPLAEGVDALEWELLLQAYLGMHGAKVSGLTHSHSAIVVALGQWREGRVDGGDLKRELWLRLSAMLGDG